ncbi:MAG: hypothetical protein HRU19_01075 [Pseudobacteriovorax sp.]|nr:hypothetical protein [Pseudobacteriovorax sp.]
MGFIDSFEEWEAYCLGQVEHDYCDFYTLLMEREYSPELTEQLLGTFEEKEELSSRLRNFFLEPIHRLTDDELKILIQKDLDQKRSVLKSGKECLWFAKLDLQRFRFTNSRDEYEEARVGVHANFMESVEDYISDHWIKNESKYFALHEMYYGLTQDFFWQWYLSEPFIKAPNLTSDIPYRIRKGGIEYAITETDILALRL